MKNSIQVTIVLLVVLLSLVSAVFVPLLWAISFYAQISLAIVLSTAKVVVLLGILLGVLYRW